MILTHDAPILLALLTHASCGITLHEVAKACRIHILLVRPAVERMADDGLLMYGGEDGTTITLSILGRKHAERAYDSQQARSAKDVR
jgi:hypothetical protein